MYTFILIGCGNIGYTLANTFKSLNYRCIAYLETDDTRAIAFNKIFPEAARLTNENSFSESDFIMISVQDDKLKILIKTLSQKTLNTKHIFHTSGYHSSEIFDSIAQENLEQHSIHPLVSVPDATLDVDVMNNIYYTIEGDNSKWMKELLGPLPLGIFQFTSEDKKLYHSSAVVSANLILSVLKAGKTVFGKASNNKNEFENAFYPLIKSVIDNMLSKGLEKSLSGPIARGDKTLINEQIELLKNNNLNEEANLYLFLTNYLKGQI